MIEFVEKLEGKELIEFRKELNKFHLELWAIQFTEKPVPICCRELAKTIRERHYEITRNFKLLDT